MGSGRVAVAALSTSDVEWGTSMAAEDSEPWARMRRLVAARDGGVWTWSPTEYRLIRWNPGAPQTHTVVRRPEWFPEEPVSPFAQNLLRDGPPPTLVAVVESPAGLLWTFTHVPVDNWREVMADLPRGEMPVEAFPYSDLYRTNAEVLEPVSQSVVAFAALDDWIISVLPGPRAVTYEVLPSGYPEVRIVELSLR
jgi:hypothetical protein